MSTPLIDIAMMNFDELSRFVQKATNSQKYIAHPQEASNTDLEVCCEYVVNTVLMPALKNEHARKDSRSLKVGENDYKTAQQLASAALTYWQDHGFIISQNARVTRAISAQIKEAEIAEAKQDMIALQLNTVGAILGAKAAKKSGCLQGFFDFEESTLQFARITNEGFAGKHFTLAAIA